MSKQTTKNITITVRVNRATYAKISRAARGENRSISRHVAHILEGGK